MDIAKTIHQLGLDTKHQIAMVHMVCSMPLSTLQKRNLLAAVMDETNQTTTTQAKKEMEIKLLTKQIDSIALLGHKYSPEYKGNPPGMATLDRAIWDRYRDKYKSRMEDLYYNVRVGTGTAPSQTATPKEMIDWVASTMLRIDVVALTRDKVQIIEVKPSAGREAFGAVLLYLHYWQLSNIKHQPATAIIVTDNMTPQIRKACTAHNIEYNII